MITTVISWKSVLLIRLVPRMKKSADSDNLIILMSELNIWIRRLIERTIVRDEHRLVSYLLQWFFLFLYQKYGWIYGNLTQNE